MKTIKLNYAFKFRAIVPSKEGNYLIRKDGVFKHEAQKQFIFHQDEVAERKKLYKEITPEEYNNLKTIGNTEFKESNVLLSSIKDTIVNDIKKNEILPEGHYLDEQGYEITPIPDVDENANNEEMKHEDENGTV